ncbi:MAG: L,D-transpeptidase [Candidatus Binatia bacterium]|nr:L,D-transpeptidase [Candidatus Binatia bacterium]
MWIRVCLANQSLELLAGERVVGRYPVSTAANGAGEQSGSLQTPRGAHEVKELIGAGAPCGAVFSARCLTGEILTPELQTAHPERDWILSRVIWLSGLEDGRNLGGNVDTHDRYIYIHGTPDDQPMGEPHSHGCVRMRNEDVIALFEELQPGTKVQIDE